MQLTIQSIYVV